MAQVGRHTTDNHEGSFGNEASLLVSSSTSCFKAALLPGPPFFGIKQLKNAHCVALFTV